MKQERTHRTDEHGIFYTEETVQITPEDGIVSERTIRPAAAPQQTRGKARMGYSTTKSFSTNDPKVGRVVTAFVSGFFFLCGLLFALFSYNRWMGIFFMVIAVYLFVTMNRKINQNAAELKAKGADVTIDSPEELHEVVGQLKDQMTSNLKEASQETFTKNNMKDFTRKTLPFYCILGLITSLALGFAIHVAMGVVVFLLLTVFGVFYYGILIKLITKHSQKND